MDRCGRSGSRVTGGGGEGGIDIGSTGATAGAREVTLAALVPQPGSVALLPSPLADEVELHQGQGLLLLVLQ